VKTGKPEVTFFKNAELVASIKYYKNPTAPAGISCLAPGNYDQSTQAAIKNYIKLG
tara:strand:+ start:51 stop:218 length:168 start_codon:yes stop_codon:yes gene_type:complete